MTCTSSCHEAASETKVGMQDAAGALAVYTSLIAQQPAPGTFALHANRAAAQLALGRWEEAVEDCDIAARLLLGEAL